MTIAKGILFAFGAGVALIAHISISFLVYHLFMLMTECEGLSIVSAVFYFILFIVALGVDLGEEFSKGEPK